MNSPMARSTAAASAPVWVRHPGVKEWVTQMAHLATPERIVWCDGSPEEYDRLCQEMVTSGMMKRLNPKLRPNSYLALSDPSDVARVEDRTFICCEKQEDAGPTNNWIAPAEMRGTLAGCSTVACAAALCTWCRSRWGRWVRPSHISASNFRFPLRRCEHADHDPHGHAVFDVLGEGGDFVPCMHSVGAPLAAGKKSARWPCNAEKWIVHFPETREIWSYGSGYGGNALLGKKCLALRIASVMARDQGWLAEHMLILGIESRTGKKPTSRPHFPAPAARPISRCSFRPPDFEGWKVRT